jgi:subtilase family serine protease
VKKISTSVRIFAALAWVVGASGVAVALPGNAQQVELPGHLQPRAQQRFDAGAVPDTLPMVELKLVLRRTPSQTAALQRLLAAQQTPGSPEYHQWLTPAQFGARFGAGTRNIQTLSAWLQSQGFKVGTIPAGRTLLPFSGTAAQVEAAFQTSIHFFLVDGVKHFANTVNPRIPASFQPLVSGIRGLHDFRPKSSARSRVVSVPDFAYQGNNVVAPEDYAVIYDFVPLYQSNILGTGVTVAIAAQSAIDPTIATNYWAAFGVNQGQQVSSVAAAAATDPGRTNDSNESEAYLDVEIVGGLAPGAKIILVRDKSSITAAEYAIDNNLAALVSTSFSTCESALGSENASISNTYSQAAAQGITVVVSTGDSGIAECDYAIHDKQGSTVLTGLSVNGLASTPYNLAVGGTDFNPILMQSGSYWNTSNSPGTNSNAKSHIPEMVWNFSCANPVYAQEAGMTSLAFCNDSKYAQYDVISGGGGGVSSCVSVGNSGTCNEGYAQPTWQSGVAGLQGATTRVLPDVSMLANDWSTCDQSVTTCGPPSGTIKLVSGTSAAAPAMAALLALLDQSLISKSDKDGRQGNINPILYKLAATEYGSVQNPNAAGLSNCSANNGAINSPSCVFNDVTTGSNGQPCNVSKFSTGGSLPTATCAAQSGDAYGVVTLSSSAVYSAAAGYDPASGLGSVNAANLVQTLASMAGPSGLAAAASGTTINLSWTASPNATGYDIYEGTASGAEAGSPVQTAISGTTATVTGLQAGQTYYFYVTAVTASGQSLPSNEANATLVPAAPTGVATSGGVSTITLTWNASSGAASYSVLEGSTAGGEASTPVATGITGTTYTLSGAAGATGYFEVIAVNQGGNSAPSSEVSGTVLPTSPSGLTATGGNASVTLAWTAGLGAASYSIFQGASAGGETSTPVMSNVTGTSATISGLANSTKYYFKVTSVNAAGSSAPSAEASATTTTPSSGGGSITLWELLLMTSLAARRLVPGRQRVSNS